MIYGISLAFNALVRRGMRNVTAAEVGSLVLNGDLWRPVLYELDAFAWADCYVRFKFVLVDPLELNRINKKLRPLAAVFLNTTSSGNHVDY